MKKSTNKIAFCFLLYSSVNHEKIWEKFFSQDKKNRHSIVSHIKTINDTTPNWLKKKAITTIRTEWCEQSLVFAWAKLLRKAFKNKENKFFVLLSGECIPFFTFPQIYSKVFENTKSRVNIDNSVAVFDETGLFYADQWVLLNRKCAKLMIDLVYTEKGKKWMRKIKPRLCIDDGTCYCPDEVYPVNWFVYHFGKPSSESYKKEIEQLVTTYTYWTKGNKPHPFKFTLKELKKMKKKICKSNALFGRKFYNDAAEQIALKCKKINKKNDSFFF